MLKEYKLVYNFTFSRSVTDSIKDDSSTSEPVSNTASRSQSSSDIDQLKKPEEKPDDSNQDQVHVCTNDGANNELPENSMKNVLGVDEIDVTHTHDDVEKLPIDPSTPLNESIESGEVLSPVKFSAIPEIKLTDAQSSDKKLNEELTTQPLETDVLVPETNEESTSANARAERDNVETGKSEAGMELELSLTNTSGEIQDETSVNEAVVKDDKDEDETEIQSKEELVPDEANKSAEINTSTGNATSEKSSSENLAPPVSMVTAPTPAPLVLQPGQLIFIQTTDGLVPQQVSIPFAALAPAPVAGIESVNSHPNATNQHSHTPGPTVLLASAAVPEAAPILLNTSAPSESKINVNNSSSLNTAEHVAEPQPVTLVQPDQPPTDSASSFSNETTSIPAAQEMAAPSVLVAGLPAQPHVNFAVQANSLIAQTLPDKITNVSSRAVKSESSSERVSRGKRRLPKNWRSAVDPSNGNTYYYHAKTRHTQWNFPLAKGPDDYSSSSGDEV